MAPAIQAIPPVAAGLSSAGPSASPPGRSFASALQRALARPDAVQANGLGRDAGRPGGGGAAAGSLLEAVDRARGRLDAVQAAARSGRTFTAQELLGLQAETYRTVQTVDLATRLVEQGAQSVKQALAAQV